MIFERSWELGDALADWMLASVVLIVKKGKKENLRNYRPLSLTSVPGKAKGKIFLWGIEKHLKNNVVIHCVRGKSGSSNLWSFYDKADQGKPVDALFLDFN